MNSTSVAAQQKGTSWLSTPTAYLRKGSHGWEGHATKTKDPTNMTNGTDGLGIPIAKLFVSLSGWWFEPL